MLRLGKMNKRVRIDKPVELQATSGELQTIYVPLVPMRWAEIQELTGREYFNAQQMTVAITTRIRLRYTPELTEKMRIVYVPQVSRPSISSIYDVQSVTHTDENHRETIAMCVKSSAQGFKKEGARA